MKNKSFGFSLVELLVVISIIGVLSAVLYANYSAGSAQSRDAERQSDIRNVQSALELYRNEYGRYPAGCNAPETWSGQSGTAYACPSGNQYIVGLAPEFIPSLPTDPKLNGANSGYVYTTNDDGTVYKFMVRGTVESETVTYDHEFRSCDGDGSASDLICNNSYDGGNNWFPPHCQATNATFRSSYAVWGGFAVPTVPPGSVNYERFTERGTEDVICNIP